MDYSFSCFSPAGFVFTTLLLLFGRLSISLSIVFLAGLPSESILLPASSDPSHPLFSKITFTELALKNITSFEKYNGDKELNFEYGCRPGQGMTT